ncbi:putative bifunctional diguanylate cyclase/phosphodiesterase [Marinomonas epiphytica]
MNWLAISLTFTGIIMLLVSLHPTLQICRKDDHLGWKALLALILFFLSGYATALYYFTYYPITSGAYEAFSLILFSGAIFVFIVIKLSLSSIQKIAHVAHQERHNALHDSLTKLPNRTYLFEHMANKKEQGQPITLLTIDLNNFKSVNDALGHHYGDLLLIATGERLNQLLPTGAFLARLGGDEFAITINSDQAEDYLSLLDALRKSAQDPITLTHYAINIYFSIGVSLFPKTSKDIEELYKQADMAMYVSKKNKLPFALFTPELNKGADEKLSISSRIESAIKQQEFKLYYQPIFGQDQTLHGAEALIRWPQFDGSYIKPEKFIQICEQSIMIEKITHWVVETAVNDLLTLTKEGFAGCLHINLSTQDLQSHRFYMKAKELSKTHPEFVSRIVFEVTESAMLRNLEATTKMMTSLNELGFRFSIDDFGTGFSSLSLLRTLPVQQIKIDRSFVLQMATDKTNYSIVKSAVYLAKNLDYSIVAEGVETPQTSTLLKELDCDYQQGYLFGHAESVEQFGKLFL